MHICISIHQSIILSIFLSIYLTEYVYIYMHAYLVKYIYMCSDLPAPGTSTRMLCPARLPSGTRTATTVRGTLDSTRNSMNPDSATRRSVIVSLEPV